MAARPRAVALSAGTFTAGGVTYNRRSASLTAGSTLAAGSYAYSLTTTDVAGNSATQSGFSVTVDNTGPSGSDVQTPSGGTTNVSAATTTPARTSPSAHAQSLVYSGPLTAMPPLRLGRVPPAAKRRYRFVARYPEPGLVDNALMGARLRFDYSWRFMPSRS